MSGISSHSGARRRGRPYIAASLGALVALWGQAASALDLPVFFVAVNGGPSVSFEDSTVCDGEKAVICYGVGSEGDLLIGSFELRADPDPYVAGSFNFYNASTTDTLSVVATVLFPLVGTVTTPTVSAGTGIVNNVFGGGILNLDLRGFVDSAGSPLVTINSLPGFPGTPFSICDDPGADPDCQAAIFSSSSGYNSPGDVSSLNLIGLQLSFDLSPDTTASIGFDPDSPFGGGAYFSLAPAVVPVPAAVWLFGSALALVAPLRRRTQRS